MSKKNKEQIRQKIQEEQGEYERERRKEWLHYKNIGRLDLYYKQKIPMMAKLSKPTIHVRNIVGNLNWWQRIYIFFNLALKRLWRKLFQLKT